MTPRSGIAGRWPRDSDPGVRLFFYCGFNSALACLSAVMLLVLRASLIRSDWLYLVLIAIVAFMLTMLRAAQLIVQQRIWSALVVIAAGNWIAMVVIVVLVPYALKILPLAALLPALLAMPYLDRRGIQAMSATGVIVVAGLSLVGRLHDGLGLEAMTPYWALAWAQILFVPAIAGLAAYIMSTNMATLRERSEALQVSRARLVTSADQERRRIERDLHDGAQQHLVAAAMHLKVAQRAATRPTRALPPLLEQAADTIQHAAAELRGLAHGIYPPQLAEDGLEAALRAATRTTPRPITITAHHLGRYSPEIETNLYFTCLEAIQNATRHAGPDATITVALDGSHGLTAAIADDGPGVDHDSLRGGHGITNMTDRVGAIGGTLTPTSTPGHGVQIRIHVPPAQSHPERPGGGLGRDGDEDRGSRRSDHHGHVGAPMALLRASIARRRSR